MKIEDFYAQWIKEHCIVLHDLDAVKHIANNLPQQIITREKAIEFAKAYADMRLEGHCPLCTQNYVDLMLDHIKNHGTQK